MFLTKHNIFKIGLFLFALMMSTTLEAKSWYQQKALLERNLNLATTEKDPVLQNLIKDLLERNPELKSLISQLQATGTRISQAGSLDDPRFSVEASNIPIENPSWGRTPMTGLQLFLRQKIPFPTKLVTQTKIARTQYEEEQLAYFEQINQLLTKFKKVYYDYRLTSEKIWLHQQTKRNFQSLVKFLETKFAAGESPLQNILKTQIEIYQVDQKITALSQMKKVYLNRLNTLLKRDINTPIHLSKHANRITKLSYNLKTLQEMAVTYRPWLQKAEKEILEMKQRKSLAKQELLPDFDFATGYRWRDNMIPNDPVSGENFFSAGVSINVPFLWSVNKHSKSISEKKYLLEAKKHKAEATKQEVKFQVAQYYHELKQIQTEYEILYNQLLPTSRSAVDTSQKEYEAGLVDFLNVITNETNLLVQRINLTDYRYNYQKKLADLEMAVGRPLF